MPVATKSLTCSCSPSTTTTMQGRLLLTDRPLLRHAGENPRTHPPGPVHLSFADGVFFSWFSVVVEPEVAVMAPVGAYMMCGWLRRLPG
jgi:hypothetical protein